MKNRDLVYRSLEIIEKELKRDINVYSVSEQFGFSLYYFSRLFKGITGYSLQNYILQRKITESYRDLVKTDKNIIDIALDYGFSTHESFTRAFCKIMGCNPSEVRSADKLTSINTTSALTKEKIERLTDISTNSPEIVVLESMKLVGIPFYYDLTLVNDLSKPWNSLIQNVSFINNRIKPEEYYQVQYWFEDQDPGFFYFFIAVEVEDFSTIPMQFTAKEIPAQKYLKFLHKGKANSVGKTYDYIYNSYLPDSRYKLPYLYNFEHYGKDSSDPYDENSLSEIFIPVED